jgi:hypothetical protein
MPNQRVVVLTDEEIKIARRALALTREALFLERPFLNSSYDKLGVALEHPRRITDDMVERACAYSIDHREDVTREELVRKLLEAALFPGEDER